MIKQFSKEFRSTSLLGVKEIPIHWEEKELKFCLKNGSEGIKIGPFGSALKFEMLVDSGYKVYGQENLIKDSFEIGNRFITEEKFTELAVYEIKEGDVLISMMGTIGKCKVVPKGIQKGIMDSHLIRLSFNQSVVLSEFAALLIQEAFYIDTQLSLNSKGSIMSGLNSSIIKNLKLLVPTIEEQRLLLNYVNKKTNQLDDLISAKNHVVKLLEEKRQAMITEVVTKGLNLNVKMKDSGVEWIGEIPEHWDVSALKFLADEQKHSFVDGPFGSDLKNEEYVKTGVPVIQLNNIRNGKLRLNKINYVTPNKAEALNRHTAFPGDLVIAKMAAPVARAAIVPNNFEKYIIVADCIKLKLKELYNNEFVNYAINTPHVIAQAESLANGTTRTRVNLSIVKNLKIVIPNYEEQFEIVQYLKENVAEWDWIISKVNLQIQKLKEYRQSLIYEAVTGKIDVRDFEVE